MNICGAFSFRGGLGHQQQGEYNRGELLQNLRVVYTGKWVTLKDFWLRMNDKINQTNQLLQAVRIHKPEEHVLGMLPDEFVYQYRVNLYGKEWTVYKSYSCFKSLRDEVECVLLPGAVVGGSYFR